MTNAARKFEATAPLLAQPRRLAIHSVLPGLRLSDLDFSEAVSVVGVRYHFVIPIPDLGPDARPVAVRGPDGSISSLAGFSFQAACGDRRHVVAGDGTGALVLTFNPARSYIPAAARAVRELVLQLNDSGPLNTPKLNHLIWYLQVEIGITDIAPATDHAVHNLKPLAPASLSEDRPFGLFESRCSRESQAVYVEGGYTVLDGPHAGQASYPHGFMAVRIQAPTPSNEVSFDSVSPSAIAYTYEIPCGLSLTEPSRQLPIISAPR